MSWARVAITTTSDRAADLGRRAEARGLEPVELPCIEVAPGPEQALARARSETARADWLVLASPRAVRSVWPEGGMPGAAVAVVGSRTAEAVVEAGGRVAMVGDGGSAELLSRLAPMVVGRSVVYCHGSETDPAVMEALAGSAAVVTALAVYRTRPVAPGPDQVDAAVFGSPSAVAGWCMSRDLEGVVLAAIGPTTGQALEERGRPPQLVSPRPDYDTLIDLLAEYMSARSPT